MIFDNIKTYYISSDKQTATPRYVRYDVFQVDNDTYIAQVYDDQQKGISPPYNIVLIDRLTINRAEYISKYQIGSNTVIRSQMAPSFEGYVSDYLQEHRNKLD